MNQQEREDLERLWSAAGQGQRPPSDKPWSQPATHLLSVLLKHAEWGLRDWSKEDRLRWVCMRMQDALDGAQAQLADALLSRPFAVMLPNADAPK